MIIFENDNNDSDGNSDNDNTCNNDNNTCDNDENKDNNYDSKLRVDSPQKGPMMLSFDVTSLKQQSSFRWFGDAMSLTQRHCDVIYFCKTVISVLMKAVMNELIHICPFVFKVV